MFSIAKGLALFGAGVMFGLLAILGTTTTALNQLRIGSESYRLIIDAKDLVADILPPPLYVIESYLETKLAVEDPNTVATRKARLTQLKQEFDTRREVWRISALPPALRGMVTDGTSKEADRFWDETFQRLLPALEAGRKADVASSMARIEAAYRDHRKAVDDLVTAATDYQTAAEAAAEAKNKIWNIVLYITAASVLGFVIAGLFGLKYRVVAPLVMMTDAMRRLAAGDQDTDVPARKRNDEIGSMARALQIFKDAGVEKLALERAAESDRQALDDARVSMEAQRNQTEARKTKDLLAMVEQVERETKGAVATVVGLMDDMTSITREMSTTAHGLSRNSDAVAQAAIEAQQTLQAARTATESLTASIEKVAAQVKTTHAVTASAVEASEGTGRSIEALSQVVSEITGVTRLITDIARQTSLLAINAGVEATRSGQDGRGFNVIATEVKTLSEQTSAATNKIIDLVRQVQDSTSGAVVAVGGIAKAIQGVNAAAAEMSDAIGEQVLMTHRIASNVVETVNMSAEVTSRVQQVAREAGVTGDRAQQADSVSSEVADHVRALHTTLVRIVRTCSAEIDRRSHERVAYEGSVEIVMGGRTLRSELSNLSEGGARFAGKIGKLGERLTLRIRDVAVPIEAQIVGHSDDGTHVSFRADAATAARLQAVKATTKRAA